MNSELLAGFFGLSAIPANQPGGTNYATGGAHDAIVNATGNINAVPTVTQISNYLAAMGGGADRNALYLIPSGGNDVTSATGLKGAGAQNAAIVTAAKSLVGGVARLQAAGAQYIVVPNQPQSFGTADQQSLSSLYNATLWSGLASAGVKFIPADFNGMLSAVAANPASFGLIVGAGAALAGFERREVLCEGPRIL